MGISRMKEDKYTEKGKQKSQNEKKSGHEIKSSKDSAIGSGSPFPKAVDEEPN